MCLCLCVSVCVCVCVCVKTHPCLLVHLVFEVTEGAADFGPTLPFEVPSQRPWLLLSDTARGVGGMERERER